MQYQTFSEKETKNLAKKLAGKIKSGVIALIGELGAGKTTFIQGFAKGLGIKEKIISPTFVLIRKHKIPQSHSILFHIDLYRLESDKELRDLGLEEFWSDPQNLVLIEWAEKAKELLPEQTTFINFEILDNYKRKITVNKNMPIDIKMN